VSPNIFEPSVCKILEVTIDEVKLVTVKLDTVISVAVSEVTAMLAARASESTPPSFIDKVLAPDPSKVVPESNCKVTSSTVRALLTASAVSAFPVTSPVKSPINPVAVIFPVEGLYVVVPSL